MNPLTILKFFIFVFFLASISYLSILTLNEYPSVHQDLLPKDHEEGLDTKNFTISNTYLEAKAWKNSSKAKAYANLKVRFFDKLKRRARITKELKAISSKLQTNFENSEFYGSLGDKDLPRFNMSIAEIDTDESNFNKTSVQKSINKYNQNQPLEQNFDGEDGTKATETLVPSMPEITLDQVDGKIDNINATSVQEIDFAKLNLIPRLFNSNNQQYPYFVYRRRDDDDYDYKKLIETLRIKFKDPSTAALAWQNRFNYKIYKDTDVFIHNNNIFYIYSNGRTATSFSNPKDRKQFRKESEKKLGECIKNFLSNITQNVIECCKKYARIYGIDSKFPGLLIIFERFANGTHVCQTDLLKRNVRQMMDEKAYLEFDS